MASTMSTDMASNITMDKGVGCGMNDLQMWQSAVKALELWICQLYMHIKSMAAHGHAHDSNVLKQLAQDLKRIWASFRPTQFCPGAVSFNHDQRRAIDLIIRHQLQNKYPHMSYNIMVSQFEDSMRAELDVVTRQLNRTKCRDVTDFESFDLNQVLERVPTQGTYGSFGTTLELFVHAACTFPSALALLMCWHRFMHFRIRDHDDDSLMICTNLLEMFPKVFQQSMGLTRIDDYLYQELVLCPDTEPITEAQMLRLAQAQPLIRKRPREQDDAEGSHSAKRACHRHISMDCDSDPLRMGENDSTSSLCSTPLAGDARDNVIVIPDDEVDYSDTDDDEGCELVG